MKKTVLATLLVLTLVVSLFAGCGKPAPASQAAPSEDAAAETPAENDAAPTEGGSDTKVALLLPGSANDHSWNQFGYEALMMVQEQLGVEVAFSENVTTIDQLQALRDYAAKGYSVVFGHSGAYEDDMIKAGKDFPDTQFVIVAGNNGAEGNVTAVDTAPWQYGYTYGWFSGKITESGKIGFITAMEGVATMNNLVGSWRDGAKNASSDVETTAIYISDMDDVAQAREAAIALAASGCDIIMYELNGGRQGVIDVCKEMGIYTLGRTAEDVAFAPEQVLTYAIFDWGPKYVKLVDMARNGELTGGSSFFGYHTPDAPGFIFKYDDASEWNPAAVDAEMLELFQKEVVEMFQAEPIRTYTVEDAASGTV